LPNDRVQIGSNRPPPDPPCCADDQQQQDQLCDSNPHVRCIPRCLLSVHSMK